MFCVALCLACGLRVDAAVNVTAPQDVRALASLKACVFGDGGGWAFNYLSSNWSDGSDPCTAAWFGVNCTQAVNCIQGVNCTLDAGGALRVRSVRLVSLSLQGDLGKWQVQEGELSVRTTMQGKARERVLHRCGAVYRHVTANPKALALVTTACVIVVRTATSV